MSDPREDLDILLPDATVHVGGRDVTVRELRFAESLEATPIARPIIEAVRAQVEIHGEELPEIALMEALAEHADAWVRLISLCTGEPVEWIRELSAEDGMRLQLAVWGRNRGFFSARLAAALLRAASGRARVSSSRGLAAARGRGGARSRSATPSASSPRPGTATTRRTSPAATPGDRSSATGRPSSGDGGGAART